MDPSSGETVQLEDASGTNTEYYLFSYRYLGGLNGHTDVVTSMVVTDKKIISGGCDETIQIRDIQVTMAAASKKQF